MKELPQTVAAVSIFLLLGGVFPLVYGYYVFLRLAIFVAALLIAHNIHKRSQAGWSVAFSIIALIFNPLIPIYLNKELWIIIDLLAALAFYLSIEKLGGFKNEYHS